MRRRLRSRRREGGASANLYGPGKLEAGRHMPPPLDAEPGARTRSGVDCALEDFYGGAAYAGH
jgi:hypothetical protein